MVGLPRLVPLPPTPNTLQLRWRVATASHAAHPSLPPPPGPSRRRRHGQVTNYTSTRHGTIATVQRRTFTAAPGAVDTLLRFHQPAAATTPVARGMASPAAPPSSATISAVSSLDVVLQVKQSDPCGGGGGGGGAGVRVYVHGCV